MLEETLEAIRPQIDGKGLRIVINGPGEPLAIAGDSARLSPQILANLIGNAIKYTPASGVIEIRVQRKVREVVISVTDTGAGIASDLLPRVFDLFMQADPTREGGLGIGLALSKQLVELHGGVLEPHSPGVGKGSTFVLRLPLAVSRDAIAKEPPRDVEAAKMGKVLVIDDDQDVADSFAMLLEGLGASVRVAYDGNSGIEEAVTFRPQIVFVDIRMRGIDGYEIARRMRARLAEDPPTLVALSGLGQENDQALSKEAGFDLHLVKPATLEAIEQLLAQNASRTESPAD